MNTHATQYVVGALLPAMGGLQDAFEKNPMMRVMLGVQLFLADRQYRNIAAVQVHRPHLVLLCPVLYVIHHQPLTHVVLCGGLRYMYSVVPCLKDDRMCASGR